MTKYVGEHIVSQFCIWIYMTVLLAMLKSVLLAVFLAMLMTAISWTADCDTGHAIDSGIGSAPGCAGKYPDCKLF